jgi:hypothetical protein
MENFPQTELPTLIVFSFLPGNILLHKIALLNKRTRAKLPNSAIIDQIKVVTVKEFQNDFEIIPAVDSFLYTISLVNGIRIQIDANQSKFA